MLVGLFEQAKDVAFSLIGDFGKAHRRFKYREDEQGYLACKVAEDDGVIYVNKVGTFGITSTPYWWSRLSGALLRLGHFLIGPAPLEALLYADDLETMGVGRDGRKAQVVLFVLLAALGAPFKWKKQRGGMVTEWIGLTTEFWVVLPWALGEEICLAGGLDPEAVCTEVSLPEGVCSWARKVGVRRHSSSLGKTLLGTSVCLGCGCEGPEG